MQVREDQPTRRGLLTGKGLLRASAAGVAVAGAAKSAQARSSAASLPPVLLQLYLRGGADALTLCVPYDDPHYRAKRVFTRVPAPQETGDPNLDATKIQNACSGAPAFGIPPALKKLKPLYDDGELVFVHACGSKDPTRSHFLQQSYTERGEITDTPNQDANGWIGRHLATSTPLGSGSLRALGFNTFAIESYAGGNGVTPTPEPETFTFPGDPIFAQKIQDMYVDFGEPLATAMVNDQEAVAKLQGVDWDAGSDAYPDSVLGSQFKRSFQVINSVPDIEVISLDYDNITGQRWDTHNSQGVFDGTMKNLMEDLSDSLVAFLDDMRDIDRRVIVLVYTEFGRTLQENDGKGTDHGRGGVALLAGDGVDGKRVVTQWPGLDPDSLDPPTTGDLAVTIDIRDVQGEIVVELLGNTIANVFPDTEYSYQTRGLLGTSQVQGVCYQQQHQTAP